MRYISIILAFHLVLLTVAPLFSVDCCSPNSHSCSSTSHEKKNKDQTGNTCSYGICCSNCLFVNSEEEQLKIIKITSEIQKIRIEEEHVFSNYSSEAWHPPEIS
mgnify:CR=1 FL=1